MRIVPKGNKNAKILAYTSPALPILEYGAACWDPYRECQVSALDLVQNKSAKFVHNSGGSDWETLAQLSVNRYSSSSSTIFRLTIAITSERRAGIVNQLGIMHVPAF